MKRLAKPVEKKRYWMSGRSAEIRQNVEEDPKVKALGYISRNIGDFGVFEDDAILPCQYFDQMRAREQSPFRKLLWAILQDAVELIEKGPGNSERSRKLFNEAVDWVSDLESDGRWTFSFKDICEWLYDGENGRDEVDPKVCSRKILQKVNPEAKRLALEKQDSHQTA